MSTHFLWLNGTFHDASCLLLPAHSAGHLLGWGVFTTIGVKAGRPLFLSRHIERLCHDAAHLSIEVPLSPSEIAAALRELLLRNSLDNGTARLTVTQRGDGRWSQATGSDFLILAHASPALKTEDWRLTLSPYRSDARRALAGIKSTSYMEFQMAWQHARHQGFDEAIICSQNGAVSEASRANVFWVRENALFTPSRESGCLPGIARELLLQAAARDGIEVHEGLFSLQELLGADEVFLTSATGAPRSVSTFAAGDIISAYAAPGALTQRLRALWQSIAETE